MATITNSGIQSYTSSQVQFTWTVDSNPTGGFSVERALISDSLFSEITTTATNVYTYTDTTVSAETGYYYRVRPFDTGPSYGDYGDTIEIYTADNQTWAYAVTQWFLGELQNDFYFNDVFNIQNPSGFSLIGSDWVSNMKDENMPYMGVILAQDVFDVDIRTLGADRGTSQVNVVIIDKGATLSTLESTFDKYVAEFHKKWSRDYRGKIEGDSASTTSKAFADIQKVDPGINMIMINNINGVGETREDQNEYYRRFDFAIEILADLDNDRACYT